MSSISVILPSCEQHRELTEADLEVLRDLEQPVRTSMTALFGVHSDISWIFVPIRGHKFFEIHAIGKKQAGPFSIEKLEARRVDPDSFAQDLQSDFFNRSRETQ